MDDDPAPPDGAAPDPAARHPVRRRLRRVGTLLVLVLVVEYLVLPQLAGSRQALNLLGRIQPAWVVAGVVLEVLSLAAYARLTRSLLPHDQRPSMWTLFRIQLSTLAVSHVVPAGSAAGTGLGYDLLGRSGVSGPNAAFALGAQGLGSAIVLNVILWVGLLVSIPVRGFNPLYALAAVVGAVLMAVFAVALLSLTKGEEGTVRVLRAVARRLPLVREETVHRLVRQVADRIRQLGSDRTVLARAVGWAVANWLLDLAALWVFLAAFGHTVAVDAIVVSYGLANVLAALPITPGGLGIVEGVLIPTLVGFGAPRGQALLGVAAWRLVNFWLPIPAGAGSYLSLRRHDPSGGGDAVGELREITRGAERSGQWDTWATARRASKAGPAEKARRRERAEEAEREGRAERRDGDAPTGHQAETERGGQVDRSTGGRGGAAPTGHQAETERAEG